AVESRLRSDFKRPFPNGFVSRWRILKLEITKLRRVIQLPRKKKGSGR
ncbi:unnamed protein product, partial [Arabidopsis halleri]